MIEEWVPNSSMNAPFFFLFECCSMNALAIAKLRSAINSSLESDEISCTQVGLLTHKSINGYSIIPRSHPRPGQKWHNR